jgi:RHS repeat-associated protein
MHDIRRASSRPTRTGLWLGISALICAGLVAGAVSPASAGEAGERRPAVELGAFALGDGLEAALGERDGSLRFAASAGGVGLTWDSRAIGIDRSGFGHGWSVGLGSIDTDGGVRVFPASGGAYEADSSQPTGLHGYPRDDVRFVVADPDSVLDARGDAPAVGYAYELHELGGRRTLFSEAGDPVAAIDGDGRRHDWRWLDGDVRRLSMVIDPDGVSTTLDWADPTRVVVRPGANVTAAREGSGVGGEWHVRLARGAVSEIVDPVGATTTVAYDDGARVERIWSDTGAATAVSWHASPDDVARVETIRALDRAGAELSGRRWAAVGGPAAVSGWPAVADAVDAEHATELSDGKTTVVSTYGDSGAMTRRATRVTTGSGDLTVHEQRFSFEVGRAPAGRPTEVELTYRDAVGAERTARETYDYDEFGRVVRSTERQGDTADAPAIRSTAYELAASGDVLSETVVEDPTGAKPSTTTRRFGYTVVGALETITTTDLDGAEHVQRQVHDAAGNVVEDADGTVYTWDAANRQLSETRPDGTTIDTGYWADGSRQHRSTAVRSTTFYWDGDTLAAERHTERSGLPAEAPALAAAPALAEGGSGGTVSYLLGLTRHARTTTGDAGETSTTYYGTDRHGNVTDLTDEHGELAAEYTYSDYGDRTVVRPEAATDLERNPFGFAMEYTHDDGSQFLHVRTYDPGRMHFRSRDREELHNVYGFANANPIMLVDPSGRDAIMDWLPVALGAYGAAAALSGVMALITATGAVGPVALIGAAFGIVDALYTAADAVLVKSGVDLMSNDIRIGIGAGFAAVGTLFAAGGLIKLALKPWHRFETMVTGNLEKRLDKFWPPDGETALQTLQYRLYGRVPGQRGGHDLAIRQLRSKYVGELDDESLGLVANQSSEHQTRFALALQLKDAMRFNKHALDHTRMLRKKLQEGLEAEGSSDEWITSLGLEINGLIDQASSSLEEAIKRLRTAKQSPLLAPSPAQAASEFGASATGDFDRVIDDMTATLGAITSLKRF